MINGNKGCRFSSLFVSFIAVFGWLDVSVKCGVCVSSCGDATWDFGNGDLSRGQLLRVSFRVLWRPNFIASYYWH